MNLKNFKITNKGLYWGLIATFAVLYLCVGFVSTLHSITFFHLANNIGLAVLLGLTYEVGQASVLFSILMTRGKEKFLPWALMFLLTALQVTANVYASFKFMATSGSNDWMFWQKAILFGVKASSPEMYQVIISWIAGALLPVVALGMTALVAQNIKLMTAENEDKKDNNKISDKIEKDKEYDDEFGPVDLTNVEPDSLDFLRNKSKENISEEETVKKLKQEYDILTNINKSDNSLNTGIVEVVQPQIVIPVGDTSNVVGPDDEIFKVQTVAESVNSAVGQFNSLEEKDELDEKTKRLTPEKIDIPVSQEFNKDFIVSDIEEPKKKRGRPPKQQNELSIEPKKEQGLLQEKEELSVPLKEKRSRRSDPFKKKSKIKPIKNLNQIIKPSLGDEAIKLIENGEKIKEKDSSIEQIINEEITLESLSAPLEIKTPYTQDNGVEVIDAKAIPKPAVKKN